MIPGHCRDETAPAELWKCLAVLPHCECKGKGLREKSLSSLLLFTQQSYDKQSLLPFSSSEKTTCVQKSPTITNRLHSYRVHRQLKMSTFSNKDCTGSKDILRDEVFLKSNSASDLFSEFTSKFSKTSNIVNGFRLGRRHFIKHWVDSYMCKLIRKLFVKVELGTEWRWPLFICWLWHTSMSRQFSTLTKTSCYWCQTCQNDATAEEGAASCSEWCTISRTCSHWDRTLKLKKIQVNKKTQKK